MVPPDVFDETNARMAEVKRMLQALLRRVQRDLRGGERLGDVVSGKKLN